MPRDFLKWGSDFVGTTLNSKAVQSVTITRRGETSITADATLGESRFEQTSEDGAVVQYEMRDFLIPASDYTWGEPARGDKIVLTLGGEARYYEVLPNPIDGKVYRESDRYNTTLRVHTKRVKV